MSINQPAEHFLTPMKAARVDQFGSIDAIRISEIPRPVAAAGQILVRVHAAGVGPWDAWVRAGQSQLGHTLPLTLGSDISGTVEAVGEGVEGFVPGEAVYGATNSLFTGAYAEFAVADASMLARKPSQVSHIEAASVPVIACTAWQLVHTYGNVNKARTVLVHGAAGNVGSYAVQFAKRSGAIVIGTCRHGDTAYLRDLGADQVIDVDAERFEEVAKDVDIVLDTVGGDTLQRSFDVMRRGGIIVSSVSQPDAQRSASTGVRGEFFYVSVASATLTKIAELLDSHVIRAHIGEVLPLSAARQAHEMLGGKPHKRGKIVLAID